MRFAQVKKEPEGRVTRSKAHTQFRQRVKEMSESGGRNQTPAAQHKNQAAKTA